MKKAIRPAIFKWRQTEPKLIYCAVRWYLRYSLSFRDVEERLRERGLEVDHTTIWRWVQRYGPDLEGRLRRQRKPTNTSWRVDETYVRVKGRWCYLYRALDSGGATIDFVLSGLRDAGAAKRLFRKALRRMRFSATRYSLRRLSSSSTEPVTYANRVFQSLAAPEYCAWSENARQYPRPDWPI